MSHNQLDYAEQIRAQGYRLTPQREAILDTLCGMGHHATIGDLYEAVQSESPGIDRATVYRAIHFFHKMRLVVSAEVDGATVYGIASPEPHHHLVCRQCGDVAHLSHAHLQNLITHLQEEHGFQAQIDHLTIPGLCRACQSGD